MSVRYTVKSPTTGQTVELTEAQMKLYRLFVMMSADMEEVTEPQLKEAAHNVGMGKQYGRKLGDLIGMGILKIEYIPTGLKTCKPVIVEIF